MAEITLKPTVKQDQAWQYLLNDDTIKFIGFGGGAGAGKSWLICEWALVNAYLYPESRGFIARNELKRLMNSTFITFGKVAKHHNISPNDWSLDGKYNVIRFNNGSTIDLLDVAFKPTDPEYERFGSTEYTYGAMEEAGEIHFKAFDVLKSRVGRHNIFGEKEVPPKILSTFNPTRGWVYTTFYEPWKKGIMKPPYAFVQALYTDNPHTAKQYGEQLAEIIDIKTRQRLMLGDWEYDNDPMALFKYEQLQDVFSNTVVKTGEKYLIVDVADEGKDSTVFSLWEDLEEYDRQEYQGLNTEMVISKIKEVAAQEKIPYSHIAVDAIGVGAGVASNSQLNGIVGYKSSFAAIKTDQDIVKLPNVHYTKEATLTTEYKNLRTQCLYTLADLVRSHKIASRVTGDLQEKIKDELAYYKETTKEGQKRSVTPKLEIKDAIGRSPDNSDTWIMRMYFVIREAMTNENSPERKIVIDTQKNQFAQRRGNYQNNSNR